MIILKAAVIILILQSCQTPNTHISVTGTDIVFSAKEHYISKTLVIPQDKILKIKAGAKILFGPEGKILVFGKIHALGSKKNPITFSTKNKKDLWRSIRIDNTNEYIKSPPTNNFAIILTQAEQKTVRNSNAYSIFSYCNFSYAGKKHFRKKNNHKAVLEINNGKVIVNESKFEKISNIGAIQLKNAYGIIHNNLFSSCGIHKSIHTWDSSAHIHNNSFTTESPQKKCNDGIWAIQSQIITTNNIIGGKGDDGIDLKGSSAIIYKNNISHNKDDGIDVDYGSTAYVLENKISGNSDQDVIVSSGSMAYLFDNYFGPDTSSGLTLRNGGSVFVRNNLIQSQNLDIKSEISWIEIANSQKEAYERMRDNLRYRKVKPKFQQTLSGFIKKFKIIRDEIPEDILKTGLPTPPCNSININQRPPSPLLLSLQNIIISNNGQIHRQTSSCFNQNVLLQAPTPKITSHTIDLFIKKTVHAIENIFQND